MTGYFLLAIFLLLLYPQRALKVRRYELLPIRGEKFLVISDFHNNGFISFGRLEGIIERENPSAILLLGDLIDRRGGYKNTRRLLELLASFNIQIYYVHGNHESGAPDRELLESQMASLGALGLEGKKVALGGLSLAGIGYGNQATVQADLYLCHNPVDALNGDLPGLYLCGHTHGGMVRFPFIKTFYVPDQKFFPNYHKGLYELGDKKLLISSGLGNTFLPIRFLNPVEVLIIK